MMKRKWSVLLLTLLMAVLLTGCQISTDWNSIFPSNLWGDSETSGASTTPGSDVPTLPNNADLIPISDLMGYAEYTPPQISADGTKVLYRHMTDYGDSVMVADWKTGSETAVPWPDVTGNPSFTWAPDGETVLFFVDDMGDENYGLYTTNLATGATKTILAGGDNNCYYVSDNPANKKEIFLELLNKTTSKYDLYRCNYETGDMSLVLTNPGDITNYIFDHDGNLRLVTRIDEEAGIHTWMKNANASGTAFNEADWKEVPALSWTYEDADTSGVTNFMQDDNRVLYTDSSKSDTSALYTYDLTASTSEKVFEDPDYDIGGTWTDLKLDKVTAVNVYADKIEWHVLDSSFQADYDALSAVKDGEFDIFGSSDEDEYWLVAYMSDTSEADYYVYDMATKKATFLYNARPEVGEMDLAPVEPFSYTSTDGLTIHGYATFPVGSTKQNLPTVVLVHGGPWVRDTWEYNEEVQFLANRGYLVLQVNYRGSTGYGKSFMLAGDKEWGRKMHQDILDAVSYAVDQGWTDKDRVGIYGASYGGYEALVSGAFSSDVFQCAVDAFGPSSLLTFIKSIPPQWSVEYQDLVRSVGDPDKETEDMRARSPLYFADDITIPMLIAQGENDVRVPQSESDQMVDALKTAGVPVNYMLFPNTGHGFNSMEARVEFYSAMEDFFAQYLGGLSDGQ
jgi:dipeptidyl aminopeptidase/acylaminoacyl peptidase